MLLDKINGPKDLKNLSINELDALAEEVRAAVINRVSKMGGHIGPNLGVVELTIALHYVFDSPKDKLVFDVSHQCYPHKILTGRKEAYLDENHFSDVSGFTNPLESEHDMFTIGHTSTSISLALGLATARDLNNEKENVIAIIGDGSLSGGEALEGLNNAFEFKNNLIIIVNDNNQSIAENHGGIYKSLEELRKTNGKSANNIFKSFGLDYRYLDEGNNIAKLIDALKDIKDINHPIVLHIHTLKGKGLSYAEANKEKYHQGSAFNPSTGEFLSNTKGYSKVVLNSLINLLETNPKAAVINAATPMRLGFNKDLRNKYVPRGQYIDVGIAEEHAVALASGMAKNNAVAVFGTLATFLQRTYDQVLHDLCLNDNKAVILVLLAGVFGMNSNTHLSLTDVQMYAHIPNFIYFAPTSKEEYEAIFKYATSNPNHPIGIRVPVLMETTGKVDNTDYSKLESKLTYKGDNVAIIGVSNMHKLACEIHDKIKEECNKEITVINPIVLSSLDTNLLENLKKNHQLVITLEDCELQGGYGQTVASFFSDSDILVKNYGISKKFHTNFKALDLLKENGLDIDNIINYIKSKGII